jgi:hypothetical protein
MTGIVGLVCAMAAGAVSARPKRLNRFDRDVSKLT